MLYDLRGREARTLAKAFLTAGHHEYVWDATGPAGGVYLCRMTAGDRTKTRRLTLVG
jgi:hypothetical protein